MKQNAEQAVLDIVEFNMMDIMKEFAEIMNLSTDDLKKIVGDGVIKVSHNGKPIIDIENGVDKLAQKDVSKKIIKKKSDTLLKEEESKKGSYVPPVVDTPCTCDSQSCTYPEAKVTYNTWLNKDLFMATPNNFIVINKVDGYPLATSKTEITFSHVTENGWVPGITNNQLLAILCERFKKDPKKVETLKALMNS